ncbi:MAG TPA: response regulator [Pyrinomonadaceae bacterium]|nr:response regulator [Pyrinomonadaceae bacterium]
MNATKGLLHRINDPGLSPQERAKLRCQLARQLEQAWNFEAAREAMGHLWQRVGERPNLEGIDEETKGEVLLRSGALTGWIGSTRQIEGAQETAKNLITESIAIFESLGRGEKVSEAQVELAYCYWRQGAFDEARVLLQEALSRPVQLENEIKALGILRTAIVEESANRFHDAHVVLKQNATLFEALNNDALQGKFHNEFGFVSRNLFGTEQRNEYLDQALIEYTAASFYFERAKLARHQACVENNLGFLYGTIRKFGEAHQHLDRAQAIFTTLRDLVHLAQVDETRARVMLAEGRVAEAERLIGAAVAVLQSGGEQSLLAEALVTQGTARARLGRLDAARSILERAIEAAEQAGDREGAGGAALTLVEELGQYLSGEDLCAIIERAKTLLENTRNMRTLGRLAGCACHALFLTNAYAMHPDWSRFSWREVMRRYEAHFIELALRDAAGSVTEAARLLGMKHYQSLSTLLHKRHKNLLHARSAIVRRKRGFTSAGRLDKRTEAVRILLVEDNEMVAGAVTETLETKGWAVEGCSDGTAALERIESDAHYDLLLLDYDLPGVNGIELVHRARKLAHRSHTPIIVLSATPVEAAALKAGADEFLPKPKGVSSLVETISRLLGEREEESQQT